MEKLALFLDKVSVELGGDLILHDINMQIHHRDFVIIIGPSGGGKTVLLKTMAGIYHPSQGAVYCEGEDWQNLKSEKKREMAKHIGVQFQKAALFDSLTVFENVAFPMREHTSWSEDQIANRVIECLDAVGLSQVQNLYSYELSGGMQLRLGIARAHALRPDIIFYDDPTAGLDPVNTDKMIDLIKELKQKFEPTVVLVTHSVKVAFELAGRIFLVVNQGVIETGSADETKNHFDPRVQQFIHGDLKGPLTEKNGF